MSISEMDSKVKELRELHRMAEELAESDFKPVAFELGFGGRDGTLPATDWRVTYKAVNSTRLDTAALKKALPDLAAQFTKTTAARRFCIA